MPGLSGPFGLKNGCKSHAKLLLVFRPTHTSCQDQFQNSSPGRTHGTAFLLERHANMDRGANPGLRLN